MAVDIVVLGAGGTVGRALIAHLRRTTDARIHAWDRRAVPLVEFDRVRATLATLAPRYVYNLAVASSPEGIATSAINTDLPQKLGAWSNDLGYRLVHASSVMVFTDAVPGPIGPEAQPDATNSYGLEKRRAEEGLSSGGGDFVTFRLGWQIAAEVGANSMVDHLERAAGRGAIKASRRWLPACSFVEQTARGLWRDRDLPTGLYNLSTNEGHSYFEIAQRLKQRLGKAHWSVEATDDYVRNQRLVDERLEPARLFEP